MAYRYGGPQQPGYGAPRQGFPQRPGYAGAPQQGAMPGRDSITQALMQIAAPPPVPNYQTPPMGMGAMPPPQPASPNGPPTGLPTGAPMAPGAANAAPSSIGAPQIPQMPMPGAPTPGMGQTNPLQQPQQNPLNQY
jgi:ABC-2 type transport system ATP-binding protein